MVSHHTVLQKGLSHICFGKHIFPFTNNNDSADQRKNAVIFFKKTYLKIPPYPFNYFFPPLLFLVLWKVHTEFLLLVLTTKYFWRGHMTTVTAWCHQNRTVNTALQQQHVSVNLGNKLPGICLKTRTSLGLTAVIGPSLFFPFLLAVTVSQKDNTGINYRKLHSWVFRHERGPRETCKIRRQYILIIHLDTAFVHCAHHSSIGPDKTNASFHLTLACDVK